MQTLTEIIYDLYADGHSTEAITAALLQDPELSTVDPVSVHTVVTEILTYLHQEWEADMVQPEYYHD
jgi:hypothetical protein